MGILDHINSVCPDCYCDGHVVSSTGAIEICDTCKGKGYLTYQELLLKYKKSKSNKSSLRLKYKSIFKQKKNKED